MEFVAQTVLSRATDLNWLFELDSNDENTVISLFYCVLGGIQQT